MATIIDSFLVTLESKADSSGFDLFDQLSRRFVITLGDVINLAERAAGALGRMFAPALEADVLAAKIKGFGYDVESTWKTLMDMSLQMGTPFQEALDGFTKLKSYGVDPLNGSLQMLKTITAATGGDLARTIVAYGQASAMGSLQGQEKNQFINAGVDIWGALSRYTGKKLGELQDMMRQKQITADILTSALKQEAERLKPIAHEVSQTLKAQLTNLSTIWYAARSKIAQTRVWDEVTKGAISMVKSLTAVLNDTTLTAAFKKFDEVVFNTIENVKRLIYVIGDNFPLMVAITSYALLSLIPVLAALIPWLTKVGNAFVGLATKMLMNPLTWYALAIGTVVAVLTDLDDALAGRETVVKWSKDVVAAWGIVKQYIVVIADFILSIFDGRLWNKLGNWWQGFLVEVKQGIEQIKLWLSEALYQLPGGKFLMALFGKLDSTLGFAGNKLVAGAEATANAVSPTTERGGSFWSRALNWSMRNFNPITGEMTAGGQAMQSAINTAKQNQQQNATVIHQDNSVKVDATITGVQNPQEVGREVNDQVKQAQKENATVRANNKTAVTQ
uniref:Tail length tape measure protein n=1 Tax=Salmonella phage vB_SEnST11_KE24 TaxID=3161175 RepID=A0AAU8GFS6_9CAUD